MACLSATGDVAKSAREPHPLNIVSLRDQNLRLLHQARHVNKTRRPAARAPAHETLLRLPVDGLGADEARLPLRVLRARLRRDRDCLRVLLICVVLLSAACFFYWFAELVVPAFFPMLHLAFSSTVARAAAAAFLAQGKPKLGGADGAMREDHLVYGQIAPGQTYDAKCCKKLGAAKRLVPYSR